MVKGLTNAVLYPIFATIFLFIIFQCVVVAASLPPVDSISKMVKIDIGEKKGGVAVDRTCILLTYEDFREMLSHGVEFSSSVSIDAEKISDQVSDTGRHDIESRMGDCVDKKLRHAFSVIIYMVIGILVAAFLCSFFN